METGLKEKVALVSGASRGLGRAVAEGLAAEGCALAICARGAEGLASAAGEIAKQHGVPVWHEAIDLSQAGAGTGFVRQAMQQYGRVDVLVNNAGGPPAGGWEDFSQADWRRAVELTLFSAQEMTREALPVMRENGWGRVINMTSISVKQPLAGLMLSNSIRAAVVGWAKSLADEVASQGITINNVMPGYIHTERVEALLAHRAKTQGISRDRALADVVKAIPMGRAGRPEEFADLVVFLASERASYITGASYLIDGGMHRGLM
jgi:3-oxoacyl-[acyl-carrier protein] reductase